MKRRKIIIIGVLVLAVLALIFVIQRNSEVNEEGKESARKVELLNISDYQRKNVSIFSFGQVESMKQVDLKTQLSGEVKSVNVELGEEVSKGKLLVELDHSALDAQLNQASATVERTQNLLEQALAGATPEQKEAAEAQMNSAELAYKNAENSLNNLLLINKENVDSLYDSISTSLNDAYIKMNSAYDTVSAVQELYFTKNDQESLNIKSTKNNINDKLTSIKAIIDNAQEDEEIDIAIVEAKDSLSFVLGELERARESVDSVNYKSIVSDTYKTALETQKTYINGSFSGLETLENNLSLLKVQNQSNVSSSEAQLEIAKANYDAAKANYNAVIIGPREVDISALRSAVKEAEAAYDIISNSREKAFIRAPFYGTISSVPIKENNLISAGQIAVSMINNSGLQVKTYVSTQDRKLIQEGAKALINDKIEGVVSKISPSIDPTSKKIELIIAISEESDLIIGEYVNIDIYINEELIEEQIFFLPFESILIKPDKNYIYYIDNGVVKSKEVELGKVIGEYVQVKGLEEDMVIIESTRGLNEGDKVEAK